MSVTRESRKSLRKLISGAAAAAAATTALASCAAAGPGADASAETAGLSAPGQSSSPVISGDLNGVAALSDGNVWAVGSTLSTDPMTVHWNGHAWREQDLTLVKGHPADPPGVFEAVAAVSPHDIWAVGGTAGATLAEHWNGKAWTRVPSPHLAGGGTLNAVTALSPTDAWAVGTGILHSGQLPPTTVIEHWDGRTWKLVPSPAAGYLNSVTAVSADSVWAAGSALGGSGDVAVVEHWNGKAWTWPVGSCASPPYPNCPLPPTGGPGSN